ncbi:MAG: RNA polymerase sigma factor [Dehalobacterium sp.]|jgi:RNA polymerase sigma factor (sigma-70 family)
MLLFAFVIDDHPNAQNKNTRDIHIDEKLLHRIGKNDMDALEELYYSTERTLYAFILSMTKDHDATLELMQETYLKIMSAAHLYRPMGKPLAWIFTIAKNLYLSKTRKKKREIIMDAQETTNDLRFSYVTDLEDKVVLEAALDILTEDERKIVLLHAVSAMKHKDIAESIGLKLSTTLSKYHRALKKLRDYLTKGSERYEGQ